MASTLGLGAAVAVPLRVAVTGVEPAVASVTVRVAVRVPAAVGPKVTVIAQTESGASGMMQLLWVILNSSALGPLSGATVRAPVAVPPLLVRLNVVGALVSPTSAVKEPGLGVMVILVSELPPVPTPLKDTVSPARMVSRPLSAPTELGPNLTEMVQVAATAVLQVVLSMMNLPVTVGVMDAGPLVTVTVTVLAALIFPTAVGAKVIDAGATVRRGVFVGAAPSDPPEPWLPPDPPLPPTITISLAGASGLVAPSWPTANPDLLQPLPARATAMATEKKS
jgi:hypothetical protein